jgi:hypothetical protein
VELLVPESKSGADVLQFPFPIVLWRLQQPLSQYQLSSIADVFFSEENTIEQF